MLLHLHQFWGFAFYATIWDYRILWVLPPSCTAKDQLVLLVAEYPHYIKHLIFSSDKNPLQCIDWGVNLMLDTNTKDRSSRYSHQWYPTQTNKSQYGRYSFCTTCMYAGCLYKVQKSLHDMSHFSYRFTCSCKWCSNFHWKESSLVSLDYLNKLASLEATLVRNSAHSLTHWLTDRGEV